MEVRIKKLTDVSLMQQACEATMRGQKSKLSLQKIYQCEHSPIRTQLFWVELIGVPTFVSVHLVRHKVGVEHFVMSNRTDRGGSDEVNRLSPVNHSMLLNAQTLIQMARKRLCSQASKETQDWFKAIKEAVKTVDEDLYHYLVVECEYRNGICPELRCCGRNKAYFKQP